MAILYVLEDDEIHEILVPFISTVGGKQHPLPSDLKDYFTERCPGGILPWDTDYVCYQLPTEKGMINMVFEKPEEPYNYFKFRQFVEFGEWRQKTVNEIPGIGRRYRPRFRANLDAYCSVSQLYDMFLYWMSKGCPYKFLKLLHWATAAYNTNGFWNNIRTFEAFRQKHEYNSGRKIQAVDPAQDVEE